MGMSRQGCMDVRWLSLARISSASAAAAKARNLLSFGSTQSATASVTAMLTARCRNPWRNACRNSGVT